MQHTLHQRRPGIIARRTYARHASPAFNNRMDQILQDLCREIASELGSSLQAIILGGNYGRGDGGTRRVVAGHGRGVWSIGEAPAEDIDLLVISWYNIKSRHEAIEGILQKYEKIFEVPLDLFPIITPLRLYSIPRRFHWVRLIHDATMLYGSPKIQRRITRLAEHREQIEPSLSWSLLHDQGLRIVSVLAMEQFHDLRQEHHDRMVHQGKFFREMAVCLMLSRGSYSDSTEVQLHDFICFVDDHPGLPAHIRLLKSLLPRALSVLQSPQQTEFDIPETWLFHLNLWLECYEYMQRRIPIKPGLLMMIRIKRLQKSILTLSQRQGTIPESMKRRLMRHISLLRWTRTHLFGI